MKQKISISIEKILITCLEKMAKEEKRSLSNMIEVLIEKAIKEHNID